MKEEKIYIEKNFFFLGCNMQKIMDIENEA